MFAWRKAGNEKRIHFTYNKDKYYTTKQVFLGGNKAGGRSSGGGGKEGEDAMRQVTWSCAPSPFGCDPGHPVKSFDISQDQVT